jgi:hypothetical protein
MSVRSVEARGAAASASALAAERLREGPGRGGRAAHRDDRQDALGEAGGACGAGGGDAFAETSSSNGWEHPMHSY